jgi:hypothetical protein
MENSTLQAGNSRQNDYGTVHNGSATTTNSPDDEPPVQKPAEDSWPMRDILRLEIVRKALLCYGALAFVAVAHDAIWTLW